MKRDRFARFMARVPSEIAHHIYEMASPARTPYRVVSDIVISYVQAAKRPPLRDETMKLLYNTVAVAQYGDADALVQDLCKSLERAIRAAHGELREDEAEVDNDILEMFTSVINEKEFTIHKHV